MFITYDIQYDAEKRRYFIAFNDYDRLDILPPHWFSPKVTPQYRYKGEKIKISKKADAPTKLTLRDLTEVEVSQTAWRPSGNFLPNIRVNGITCTNPYRINFFDRFIIYMPMILVFFGGLHGGLTGGIAVSLNIALMRTPWKHWQKTVSILVTSLLAAIIYFTGVISLAAYLHLKNIQLQDLQTPTPRNSSLKQNQPYIPEEDKPQNREQPDEELQEEKHPAENPVNPREELPVSAPPSKPSSVRYVEVDDSGGYGQMSDSSTEKVSPGQKPKEEHPDKPVNETDGDGGYGGVEEKAP